jgi:hypothetical protein
MKRTGEAILPLHTGRAPAWLMEKMILLSREIMRIIVEKYGTEELLIRLSDPFWFQSLGCVLGFDWHSSGLTTTTCAALREAVKPLGNDLNIFACGGKGKAALKTLQQVEKTCDNFSISKGKSFIYASKMSAKVDSACVQDGFNLYHHMIFFTQDKWCVIQQGLDGERWARRYHWLSKDLRTFICEPHKAICSPIKRRTLNLVAKKSSFARECILKLSKRKPEEISLLEQKLIKDKSTSSKRLEKAIALSYNCCSENFEQLIFIKGIGAKTLRALALLSEIIFGAPLSFKDPARYTFAHGGKDGVPYPVDLKTYRNSIEILKIAVEKAKIGHYEKMRALRRLSA